MELSSLIDAVMPGDGSALDRLSKASQARVRAVTGVRGVRPIAKLLHGNEWLGHPLHPVIVTVPIGAWFVAAVHDARSATTDDPDSERAADAAIRIGIAGAALSALTGVAQYVDTSGGVRRETAVHAALNTTALGLYLGSLAARKRGQRPRGRKLANAGFAVAGISGYLGGDISYRHGVGVRPQALRHPSLPAPETSDAPLAVAEVRHA